MDVLQDYSTLPAEIVASPQPLVGVVGLDIVNNAIHESVWEIFHSRRPDNRITIRYKIVPSNFEFPVAKPKRQNYEWYYPKGILKRNWMLKHQHMIPAVLVLFLDLEWNDPNWSDRQMQIASMVQSYKNSLQGRMTRLTIVLLQKNSPSLHENDMLASERAANLTSICDINAKMLFILPFKDNLTGYTMRLESAILELAQSYYAQMAKQVRTHRDQLSNAHLLLKIRHQFKLGFISEMRMDLNTGLKHYTQAYANLEEVKPPEYNYLEVKTIAGFLNFKLCRLMFKLNAPRDSLTQFKNHIDKYKNITGPKELLFEHYAWLSVQYNAFADLFSDAIKNGLPALQIQHPGIYYQRAAEYVTQRKNACLQCCALSMSPTEPSIPAFNIASVLYTDFFGVRTTKNSEVMSEHQIISIIQANERRINHSQFIISLLGQAMAQFKIYRCLRFRKKLAIDMAEEYLNSGDHSKALTLFSLMLTDYRTDKWMKVFTEVLLKTLRSAYLSASISDYLSSSIEALAPTIEINYDARRTIIENLWKVFQSVPPIPQSQEAPELRQIWEVALQSSKSPYYVDLDKINEVIECKMSFGQSKSKCDEIVRIELILRSKTDVPLKFNSFTVLLTDSKSHYRLKATEYQILDPTAVVNAQRMGKNKFTDDIKKLDSYLKIEPGNSYNIIFSSVPYQFIENAELQILRLEILMGTDSVYAILTQSTSLNKVKSFRNYNPLNDFMENVPINRTCYIIPTFHLSAQSSFSDQPMLVNEYYRVNTVITNSFNSSVENVGASISVPNSLKGKVFLTTEMNSSRQKLIQSIQMDLGDLQTQASISISYYVMSLIDGNIELVQKLWYQVDAVQYEQSAHIQKTLTTSLSFDSTPVTAKLQNDQSNNHNMIIEPIEAENAVRKSKEDVIIIPCVEEFRLSSKHYTLNREAVTELLYKDEDFIMRIDVEVRSPSTIEILETFFISDHNITEKDKQLPTPGQYEKGARIRDIRVLSACQTTQQWITKESFKKQESSNPILFTRYNQMCKNQENINRPSAVKSRAPDSVNKNILSKLPSSATSQHQITVSTVSSSLTDDFGDGGLKEETNQLQSNCTVFNNAVDAILRTGDGKGFLDSKVLSVTNINNNEIPPFGVYCIRWRRLNSSDINESKFLINGLEIMEPPLNIQCYFAEAIYVKVPVNMRITVKNPSDRVLYIVANLSNSDIFMFSGHRHISLALYPNSQQDLLFNLLPLKAGWQFLPELNLDFNTQLIESNGGRLDDHIQIKLNDLVKRWMPKQVFVLPPHRERNDVK